MEEVCDGLLLLLAQRQGRDVGGPRGGVVEGQGGDFNRAAQTMEALGERGQKVTVS